MMTVMTAATDSDLMPASDSEAGRDRTEATQSVVYQSAQGGRLAAHPPTLRSTRLGPDLRWLPGE